MSLFRGTKNQHILLGILKIQIYHKTNICLPLEFRNISSNQQHFRHGFYFLRKQQFSQQKITHLHKTRGLGQTGSIFFEMLYARAYYYQVLCQFYLKYFKKGIKGKLSASLTSFEESNVTQQEQFVKFRLLQIDKKIVLQDKLNNRDFNFLL